MILDVSPLLRNRDYRLVYTGQLVSAFGSMITYVAVPDQIWQLTHSSFAVGLLGAVQLVPLLLFALWGGAYADSMDRRKLLIVSEALLAVGSLTLGINSVIPKPSVVLVFVVSGVMSALNGFHRPALDALTPRLVDRDDLRAVSALSSLRFSLSAIAGPALGGFLIGKFGMVSTYSIDCATYLVSIAALAAISRMPAPEGKKAGIHSILEGLRYARSRPELIGTYVVDMRSGQAKAVARLRREGKFHPAGAVVRFASTPRRTRERRNRDGLHGRRRIGNLDSRQRRPLA